ncbi:MAG: hypothetical protein WA324_31105 [Bryobacteraceae bacterium]
MKKIVGFLASKAFQIPVVLLATIGFLIVALYSTLYPGFIDHVEPNIASVAWVIGKGSPLYNSLDSVQRYSLLYGPLAYLPFTWGMTILGGSILSLKIVVLLAVIGIAVCLWLAYRRLLDRPKSAIVALIVIGFLMGGNLPYLLEVRGDVFIILCAAWALAAALSPNAILAATLTALACAAGADVKLTGVLYFFPIYVLLGDRQGWKIAVASLFAAGVLSFAPFLIPGISLPGYLIWLHAASRQPLGVGIQNMLEYAVKFSLPILLLMWRFSTINHAGFRTYLGQRRLFIVTLIACFFVMAVLCSKAGAGVHHLLPFCPLLGYFCADLYSAANAQRTSGVIIHRSIPQFTCWLLVGLFFGARLAGKIRGDLTVVAGQRPYAVALLKDVDGIMRTHPQDRIGMGYGETSLVPPMPAYASTYVRPALVMAGNPLTFDAAALCDMQLSGVEMPQADTNYMGSCGTTIWLIPKGEPPFSQVNLYSLYGPRVMPQRNLFNAAFRQAFFDHYHKAGSSRFFDIWSCVNKPNGSNGH